MKRFGNLGFGSVADGEGDDGVLWVGVAVGSFEVDGFEGGLGVDGDGEFEGHGLSGGVDGCDGL